MKKICLTLVFNISLFLFLIIGIQNSSNKSSVNLIVNQSVELPISFIVGMSFITGSFLGSFISLNNLFKNKD